jgi:predicted small metal-binding protein
LERQCRPLERLERAFHVVPKGPAYDVIVKQIDCVCGHVVKGDDDDELWEQAQDHLRTDHPDLVGKVSREDILAQAEEI